MESLEIRHSILRERLDVLGMHQPLPLGAVSLVTALVDDIIKTNDSLKKSKDKINRLLDEKTAWDLGVDPYKCDNTRLVNESNRVHIQLIKEREQFELSLIELQKRIRDLESDRQYLKEHCSALEEKIIGYDKNAMRNRSDSNLGKKPFVSTVRSGINPLPPTHFSVFRNSIDNYKKCVNGDLTQAHYRREMQRAEDERKTWGDIKGCLENEINKRDKEIERLSLLLSGGRPTPSLARDCCRTYNNTEDIDSLQVAKQRLREELQEVQSAQHEAMERAMKLDILNQELHANLEALKNTALSMEAEANFKIDLKNKKISELKEKLKDHSKRLEYPMEGKNDVINTQIAFESERLKLKNELREMRFRETELKKTIDKLTKKNLKLNHKYDEITSSAASIRNGKSTSTELESIKNQRDNIQKQYLDLVQNGHSNEEFESLTRKLIDREHEITSLRKELDSRFVENTKSIPAQSVQSAINRAERERDVYKQDVQKLTYERDSLREKLKLCTDMQMVENERHARDVQDKQSSIYRLEQMNQELISSKGPTEVTATLQKQTINDLNKQLEKAEAEKQELHLKYNQLKMLQEQNERLLADHQKKVMHTEFQLRRTEQVLQKADSNNDLVAKDVDVLRKEVAGLNAVNAALEEQRDKLITELDNKTEQIFVLEKELGSIRVAKVDLEVTTDTLKKKISDSQSTEQQRTRSLRDLNSEAERCRQQIAQLQGTNKNLYADNRRLIDEHAELESRQALTKAQLKESQLEVEHLKQNLTQYVEKVQQIEHSLRHLEDEREEMLRTYESLSHGASALEDSKSAMELQAKEAKLQLCQAEEKITDLQEQLELQRQNCFSHENQISAMSKQIDTLENEIEKLKDEKSLIKGDYAALKELVNKLDLQKEKLNAEVSEITNIQKTLERENGQLRSTLNSAKVGDKAAVDSLQELLTSTRKDLDEQRGAANKLSVEVKKLQVLLSESEAKCAAEHGISEKNKNLAKEYSIQIEELRHKLTDTRFAEVRNNETIGDER